MEFIPFGNYEPDQPDYASNSISVAKNVYPLSIIHQNNAPVGVNYAPLKKPAAYSDALNLRCQGAFAFRRNDTSSLIFAGTNDTLYKMDVTNAPNFTDVSKTASLYNVVDGDFWSFAHFGDRVIATHSGYEPQSFLVGTDTEFSDLNTTDAPKAKFASVIKEWTIFGHTIDATDGEQPQRVWWSAIGDPTSWPTPSSTAAIEAQSDYQNLAGDTGAVKAIVPEIGNSDGVVFTENSIYTMNYIGPPSTFAFHTSEGARGTPASESVVKVGANCYYLAEDGFYKFDGNSSIPIGDAKVDTTFFADLDQAYIDRVVGAFDTESKIIYWIYPDGQNVNGTPNKALIYNWIIDKWSTASIGADYIFDVRTFDVTLEELDATYATLEDVPASLDSPLWVGGRKLFGVMTDDLKLSYLTGDTMQADIETSQFSMSNNSKSNILSSRPIVDGNSSAMVAVGTRNDLGDVFAYSSYISQNVNNECNHRNHGKYFNFAVRLAEAETWKIAQGIEIKAAKAGRR